MAKYKQSDYEVLRRHCVEFPQQGWKQGPVAISSRKPTSAPTRLTTDQLGQLVDALNKAAEHDGFVGAI
ncbi:hypothetical protein [Spirosoma aerophilum]